MDKKYLFNTFYSASLDYRNHPLAETTVHLKLVNVFLLFVDFSILSAVNMNIIALF